MFALLAANSFVDMLIILDICDILIQMASLDTIKTQLVISSTEITFETLAYACLVYYGRRTPLLQEEAWYRQDTETTEVLGYAELPGSSRYSSTYRAELGGTQADEKRWEMPVKGCHDIMLDSAEMHEMDAEESQQGKRWRPPKARDSYERAHLRGLHRVRIGPRWQQLPLDLHDFLRLYIRP